MNEFSLTLKEVQARKKILSGVKKVYDTVKLTLGPEGKNAIIPRTYNRGPRVTNDGVTIIENILLKDPHERLAADFFKEMSKKTNQLAGDGTTGASVMGGYLTMEIMEPMTAMDVALASVEGVKPSKTGVRALRQEMKDAKDLVIAEIKKMAKPIKTLEDLEKVAVISIGKEDEEIAKKIAKLVWEIGRDTNGQFINNHIDVTEGYKGEIEIEKIEGMKFPAKVANRHFVNNPDRFEMIIEDTPVIITNKKMESAIEMIELVNKLKIQKATFFAPDFSQAVLRSMIGNDQKLGIKLLPVKCPALRTDIMEDLAAYTGGRVIDKDKGMELKNASQEDFGFAERIVVKDTENREDAVLLGGKGSKIKRGENNLITERIHILTKQMKESRNELTTISLQKRIAGLQSAVGIVRVGASTEAELLFLKLKIEDGANACKAALEEGYVEGGGLCLSKIAKKLPKNILTNAISAPYAQIQINAGGDLEIGKDVIDSAKVVRLQVEHAVSVASMLITTDIIIAEEPEVSPGEGYERIAKAISQHTYYWAVQQGIIKASEDEAESDRNKVFDDILAGDK